MTDQGVPSWPELVALVGPAAPPEPKPQRLTTLDGEPGIIVTVADAQRHIDSLRAELNELRQEIATDQRGVPTKYRKTKRQLADKESNLVGHIQTWTFIQLAIEGEREI